MEKFDLMYYEEHYDKGYCKTEDEEKVVLMYENKDTYIIQSEPKGSDLVCHLKVFDAVSLALMTEGDYLKYGNMDIGVWKTFDVLGTIIKETDNEEGWNMHWEDVMQLIQENSIDINTIINISRYIVDSEEIENQKGIDVSIENAEMEGGTAEIEENEGDYGDYKDMDWESLNNYDRSTSQSDEQVLPPGHYWDITVISKTGDNFVNYVIDSDQGKIIKEISRKIR